MLQIVADENIAYAEEAFSSIGKVTLLPGRSITNEVLKNTDILLIRSVTKINKELLKNSPVKFIGTATIGTDHINLDYLRKNNIAFSSAKGCNAYAVTEFFLTALAKIVCDKNLSFNELSIGIVGLGNIGNRVAEYAAALGMKVFKNDPPLERISNSKEFVSLDEIEKTDIITLHVPLTMEGIDKTFHLFNKERLLRLKDNTILINTSRGAVVDNKALQNVLQKKIIHTVLDVWEDEPFINSDLLKTIELGTPHIAGYSLEGKVNGTVIIYDALCRFLNIKGIWEPTLSPVEQNIITIDTKLSTEEILFFLTQEIYNISNDDNELRTFTNIEVQFEALRKLYLLRREFNNYKVLLEPYNEQLARILRAFRFNVKY